MSCANFFPCFFLFCVEFEVKKDVLGFQFVLRIGSCLMRFCADMVPVGHATVTTTVKTSIRVPPAQPPPRVTESESSPDRQKSPPAQQNGQMANGHGQRSPTSETATSDSDGGEDEDEMNAPLVSSSGSPPPAAGHTVHTVETVRTASIVYTQEVTEA